MRIEIVDEYGLHKGEVVHKSGMHDVIECEICGFKHILPLPVRSEFESLYEDEYYQGGQNDTIVVPTHDLDWYQAEYGLRLGLIEEALGHSGSVYDIGTGAGIFLDVAKRRGWETRGIEPSPLIKNTEFANGLNVSQGFFPVDCEEQEESFDFVHLSLVLEHVLEPAKLIKAARKLLKPGGYVTVCVPNDFNILQDTVVDITDNNKWWVHPHHHLNYFNFASLEGLLQKCGFDLIDRTTNFPMEMFILMGENYTIDPELGSKCHGMRKKLDTELFRKDEKVLRALYRSFAQNNIGRCAIVTGKKQ